MEEEEYPGYEIITLERTASSLSTISMVRIVSCTSANEEEIHRRINQKLLHFTEVFKEVERLLESISETLELDSDVVLVLLYHHKWDEAICIERYFNGNNSLYEELKRRKEAGLKKLHQVERCPVCLEEDVLIQAYCEHSCCRSCWATHIQSAVAQLKPIVGCVDYECKLPLLHSFVLDQQADPKQYLRCISLSYVASTKTMRFCPGVDCEFCFQDLSMTAKNVVCRCGTRFCFKCGKEPHEPCSCLQAEKWFSLTKNELSNEVWIKQNTKICPNCKCSVERAFGCNFIGCTCGNSFCYYCSGKWDELHISHYECPFRDKISKEAQNKQNAQDNQESEAMRITKQYDKFLLHNSILRRTAAELLSIGQLREDIVKRLYIPESETLFMQTALEKQLDCRAILKWSEIFQFFHEHDEAYEMREFAIFELKREMERCSYELAEFVRRARQLISERQTFLMDYSANPSLKEFHHQRESINKLVSQSDSYLRRLIEELEK